MNVDRTKFLLLTGAIAAATVVAAGAGCNTVTENSNDAGNGTDTGIESDSGGDSSSDASTDADGGTACLDDTLPSTEGGDAGVDADVDADTDAAAIGPCGAADPANGCANVCGGDINPHFKAGVAAAIDKCLLTIPQCETASVEMEGCIEDALDLACPDTTADTFCTPLVSACDAASDAGDADGGVDKLFTQKNCVKIAQGLNQAGRDAFQICINEGVAGSCTLDPDFCVKTVMHIP